MSTDGLLPRQLGYVSPGRHVPLVATFLATSIIALLATFFEIKVKCFSIVFILSKRVQFMKKTSSGSHWLRFNFRFVQLYGRFHWFVN